MGVIQDIEKQVKSEIKEIGADIGFAIKHPRELLQDAARINPKDLTVPTVTLYVQEDIGIGKSLKKELNEIDSRAGELTGVYVPPSVTAAQTVNVILYIHGDKVRVWGPNGTIRDYWNLPMLPLRQGLSSSGQPFVLIAPTLGKKAAVEFGNLGTNIDDHLDHVMAQIYKLGPPEFAPPKPPDIGQLIIAGHSGAYASIKSILSSIKKYRGNIKEIWAFDIMYVDMAPSLTPFTVPVYAYFVAGSDTEGNSRSLAKQKRSNIFVMENIEFVMVKGKEERRSVKHDNLMQKFWLDRCQRIGTNGTNPDDKKRMIAG